MQLEARQLTLDVVGVLEQMAFVLCEEAEEPRHDLSDYCEHVKVTVDGDEHALACLISGNQGFLAEFAASMLGLDEDEVEPDKQGREALQELGNVVGGEVVRILGGEHIEFDLGLPESITAKDATKLQKQLPEVVSCCLESDEGFVRVAAYGN